MHRAQSGLATKGARTPEYLNAGVDAYLHLGRACELQGQPAAADRAYEVALRVWQELAEEPPALDRRNDAYFVALNLALILLQDGHTEEGIQWRFERLRGRPKLLGGSREYALFLSLLRVKLLCGRPGRPGLHAALSAAGRQFSALVDDYAQHGRRDIPSRLSVARFTLEASTLLRKGGEMEVSRRLLEWTNRTLSRLSREAPSTHSIYVDLSESWHQIGKAAWRWGPHHDSVDASRRALEAQRRALALAPFVPEYRRGLGWRYVQLGRKLCDRGCLDEAERCFRERQALWPGDVARHGEAIRAVRKWASQVGEGKKTLSAEEQRRRQRYLDLCTRLERAGASISPEGQPRTPANCQGKAGRGG